MMSRFNRRLRQIGFVHRNFRDEPAFALGLFDVAIDRARFLHREEKFVRDASRHRRGWFSRPPSTPGISTAPISSGCLSTKLLHVLGLGRFADGVGDINREKVRRGHEAIHGFEPDVVGVDVPFLRPAEFLDGGFGGGAHGGRFDCR
jgi:hypothetical protein